MNLAFGDVGPRHQGLVGIVQHELGEGFPGGRVVHHVIVGGMLHDAHAAKFAEPAPCREVLPAQEEVAVAVGIPHDLIAEVGGPAGHRRAAVVEVPVDPVR